MTTSQHAPTGPDGGLLRILARDDCRTTLSHLRDRPDARTTIDALASDVRGDAVEGSTATASRLHHGTLPRLAAAGLVEYDASTLTVRYAGDEGLESWLDALDDGEGRRE